MPFAQEVTEAAPGGCSTGQVSITTTATKVCDANADRANITVRNIGAADCYLGPTNAVTTTAGFLLTSSGKDALDVKWTGTVYAITSSGTTTVCYIEESS